MDLIYLDHAATTPVATPVRRAMEPYFDESFGNPATKYSVGEKAADGVILAREQVGELIGCHPSRVFFTSGGTESDNWALVGAVLGTGKKHIVTTEIEHHAILNTVDFLKRHHGVKAKVLSMGPEGIVDPLAVERSITADTAVVSVMAVNNEIGTIQPIQEIAEICKRKAVLFHTDAVQAAGKMLLNAEADNIDMVSISGHKFYGPKGVGALYVREGVEIERFMNGGGQELEMRAGTLNVPAIVGMGKAADVALECLEPFEKLMEDLFGIFLARMNEKIPDARLNGDPSRRIFSHINILIPGIDAGECLKRLNDRGICASSGSACDCDNPEPSHVLTALGMPPEEAFSSLRFTMGRLTDQEKVECAVDKLAEVIAELRA